MSDNLENRRPQDGKFISLSEDWEVKYWTKTLGCSVLELKEAINVVGHSSQKVKDHIKNKVS